MEEKNLKKIKHNKQNLKFSIKKKNKIETQATGLGLQDS